MKWGKHSEKAAERMEKFVSRFLSTKGLYMLLALAAFLLLSNASEKWGK